ncbi:hypothetical protein BGZ83_003925 [Gryganskiella cystojenkinii]|nr:hypothetical protein BGZ83_003925 [Gryganskiella cystojenkinii]
MKFISTIVALSAVVALTQALVIPTAVGDATQAVESLPSVLQKRHPIAASKDNKSSKVRKGGRRGRRHPKGREVSKGDRHEKRALPLVGSVLPMVEGLVPTPAPSTASVDENGSSSQALERRDILEVQVRAKADLIAKAYANVKKTVRAALSAQIKASVKESIIANAKLLGLEIAVDAKIELVVNALLNANLGALEDFHAWVDAIVKANISLDAKALVAVVNTELYAKIKTLSAVIDAAANAKIWAKAGILGLITLNADVNLDVLANARVGVDTDAIVDSATVEVNAHVSATVVAVANVH